VLPIHCITPKGLSLVFIKKKIETLKAVYILASCHLPTENLERGTRVDRKLQSVKRYANRPEETHSVGPATMSSDYLVCTNPRGLSHVIRSSASLFSKSISPILVGDLHNLSNLAALAGITIARPQFNTSEQRYKQWRIRIRRQGQRTAVCLELLCAKVWSVSPPCMSICRQRSYWRPAV
jgi:hypothetical protein